MLDKSGTVSHFSKAIGTSHLLSGSQYKGWRPSRETRGVWVLTHEPQLLDEFHHSPEATISGIKRSEASQAVIPALGRQKQVICEGQPDLQTKIQGYTEKPCLELSNLPPPHPPKKKDQGHWQIVLTSARCLREQGGASASWFRTCQADLPTQHPGKQRT